MRIESDGDGASPAIHWSDDGRSVAVLVRAVDNKDRWIASVDLAEAKLQSRHHLTDPAWINWAFNEFGWLRDGQTLWFLSEQSGRSHLYTQRGGEKARQLTSGQWEVSAPALSADGGAFHFLCNRQWPGKYELCRLDLQDGGEVRELTALGGVEDYTEAPDGARFLLRHSGSYLPAQLAVVDRDGGNPRTLTDTRSAAFKSREWIQPEIVQVPSQHGAGKVWGQVLRAEDA